MEKVITIQSDNWDLTNKRDYRIVLGSLIFRQEKLRFNLARWSLSMGFRLEIGKTEKIKLYQEVPMPHFDDIYECLKWISEDENMIHIFEYGEHFFGDCSINNI